VMGWRTPGTLDPDTPVLDIAASVLATGRASRLYRAVREKKLASSVSAYDYTPTELGVFVVQAETEPDKTATAAGVIWDLLRQLREDSVDEHELTRVRRIFEARWVRRLETAEGRANHLAEWEALGDWRLGDEYFQRFMSATAADVQRAAKKYLAPERAAALVYRPEKAPVVARDATEMQRVLASGKADRLPPIPTAATASASPTPRAVFEREEAGVSIFRTTAGIPVLVRRKTGTPMANIGVYIAGGAVEEPAEFAGLTLLTARTMLKGTTTRTASQIADDAEMLGGTISASAASDSFGWSFSVPKSRLGEALELMGDVIQRSTIPDEAFETERTVALSNVAMLRDDMYRYPMRLATSLAFSGHPYGSPVMGTEESLAVISAERARAWRATRVLSSAGVIGIVADLDVAEAANLVAREFSVLQSKQIPAIAKPEWPTSVEVAIESRDKAQTAIALGFPGPSRSDDDRFAASLVGTVASGLGGRFFDELRDRQSLAYTVHAGPSVKRAGGMFASYIATSPEKEEIARAGLLAEFAKLREEPVSDDELSRAKEYTVGSHAISQESGGAVLAEMLDAWMFGAGLHELTEYDARVRAVSASEMLDVARRYFDPARRVEGIVRGVGRTV